MSELEDMITEMRRSLPIPELPKRIVYERPPGTLYNVYKRSFPVGFEPKVDKPVVIGLTEDEADLEIVRLIKKESKRREQEGTIPAYYFDIVPMNATPTEKDIYYNEGQITQ